MLSSLSMFRKGWVWYGVLKWILERLKSWKEEEGLNQTMLWCCIISNKFTWTFKRFLFLSKLNNYKKNIWFFISLVVFFLVHCLVEFRDGGVLKWISWNSLQFGWIPWFSIFILMKKSRDPNISRPHFLNFRWNCTKIVRSNHFQGFLWFSSWKMQHKEILDSARRRILNIFSGLFRSQ